VTIDEVVHDTTYTGVLTPDLVAGGYCIEVPWLLGVFTDADSLAEAKEMVEEVIRLYLSESGDK
jgi:predicted RNase H-like HicB family nuclease